MVRCACFKADGKQCTRDAKKESIYCWQHQNCKKPMSGIISKSIPKPIPGTFPVDVPKVVPMPASRAEIKKPPSETIIIPMPEVPKTQEGLNDALSLASEKDQLGVVKYLVNKGANVHAHDDLALRRASAHGHSEIVKYLISVGANVHANGNQALIWASERGH